MSNNFKSGNTLSERMVGLKELYQDTQTKYIVSGTSDPYAVGNGTYSVTRGQTYSYTDSMGDRLKRINEELDNMQKQKEVLSNLNPKTLEIMDLAVKVTQSYDMQALENLDKYITNLLFNNNLSNIVSD